MAWKGMMQRNGRIPRDSVKSSFTTGGLRKPIAEISVVRSSWANIYYRSCGWNPIRINSRRSLAMCKAPPHQLPSSNQYPSRRSNLASSCPRLRIRRVSSWLNKLFSQQNWGNMLPLWRHLQPTVSVVIQILNSGVMFSNLFTILLT